MTKTLYRCKNCFLYSLKPGKCQQCGEKKEHPYPARFSLHKEQKYRPFIRKITELKD